MEKKNGEFWDGLQGLVDESMSFWKQGLFAQKLTLKHKKGSLKW